MPNKINLSCELHIGRIDTHITAQGKTIVFFSAAYNTGKKGEDKPPVWLNFKAFADNAAYISSLSKGDVIEVIESTPVLETWQDKQTGETRSKQVWLVWGLGKAGKEPELPLDGPPVDDDIEF